MPIKFYYDEQKALVYEQFHGDIHMSDFHNIIENELSKRHFPVGIKAFFELKKVKIHFSLSDVLPTIKMLGKYPNQLNHARWAFFCLEPVYVAYLYYFKQLSRFLPFTVEIFSSAEACRTWLGITQQDFDDLQCKFEYMERCQDKKHQPTKKYK